jgi:hypothetical protein
MSRLEKDHHLIGYDVFIEKGNKDILHHMDITECDPSLFNENDPLDGAECGVVNPQTNPRNKCSTWVFTWVILIHFCYFFQ